MNRTQLVELVAHHTHLPADDVDAVVLSILETIAVALAHGEAVNLRSFGVFEPRVRRSSVRYHPGIRDTVTVPEKTSVGFRPSDSLKRRLNPTNRKRTR